MNKLFFLSGLPRSGSTLLAAILNQNPDFLATPTSSLIDMLGSMAHSWETNQGHHVQGRNDEILFSMMRSTVKSRYPENKYVFDKSRGWPNPTICNTMEKVLGYKPKIIATVRNVEECAASFVRVVKPDNIQDFLLNSQPIQHLKDSYLTLWDGFEAGLDIHFVNYDDLLNDPKGVLTGIHEFIGLNAFEYDFDNIDPTSVKEEDEAVWNIPGLHDIGKKLEKQHSQSAKDLLGSYVYEFMQPKFWIGETDNEQDPLTEQLELAKKGLFLESKEILDKILTEDPENKRALYNRGWFYLNDNDWIKGYQHMEIGRSINVFGDRQLSQAPEPDIFNWSELKTVLLHLEGGLGDQIWGLRWARILYEKHYKVIIACSSELAKIFNSNPYVSSVVIKDAAEYVYHDFYIRSFSLPRWLEIMCKEDVEMFNSNAAYITSPEKTHDKLRIGLRWQGNPMFEHEQNRLFPPELLFNAIHDIDAEFVSLQRDIGLESKPDWVKEVDLSSWENTINEISQCDLIISSCTSVAHMAGAMGKKTIVLSPTLNYFLWAGTENMEKSYWYEDLTLLKQCKYNNWYPTFEQLKEYLNGTFCKA